jgi:hypothetical protein
MVRWRNPLIIRAIRSIQIPPVPAVRQQDVDQNAVKLAYRPRGPESTGYAGENVVPARLRAGPTIPP